MPDPAITEFLAERLQSKIKPNMASEEIEKLQEKYLLANYIQDAAKRAKQIKLTTHPGKFTHPSARATAVVANCQSQNDGYIRSGTIKQELDAFGNAAAIDVYKFVTLKMQDGKILLEHLQQQTELAKQLLEQAGDYTSLREQLLAIIATDEELVTDTKLKQVYSPVADDYHLLSILTPSSILFAAKQKIDKIRFGENAKEARNCKKNNKLHQDGYQDLYCLTDISFGGSKPQNVSVLNSNNAGRAYLLTGNLPIRHKSEIKIPSRNFFKQTVSYYTFKDIFYSLHGLYGKATQNNIDARNEIRNYYLDIFQQIVLYAQQLRAILAEQSYLSIEKLPPEQQIWLSPTEEHAEIRQQQKDWRQQIIAKIAKFILTGYKHQIKKPQPYGDGELLDIKNLLAEYGEDLI